jgi:hypothetical protein
MSPHLEMVNTAQRYERQHLSSLHELESRGTTHYHNSQVTYLFELAPGPALTMLRYTVLRRSHDIDLPLA